MFTFRQNNRPGILRQAVRDKLSFLNSDKVEPSSVGGALGLSFLGAQGAGLASAGVGHGILRPAMNRTARINPGHSADFLKHVRTGSGELSKAVKSVAGDVSIKGIDVEAMPKLMEMMTGGGAAMPQQSTIMIGKRQARNPAILAHELGHMIDYRKNPGRLVGGSTCCG